MLFGTVGGRAGARRGFTPKDQKTNDKVSHCGPCRHAFLGLALFAWQSPDRRPGEKSADSHPRGLTAKAVKGADSLTWEQPPYFPPCFWASGEGQPAPKTLSLHCGNHWFPGGQVREDFFFSSKDCRSDHLPVWATLGKESWHAERKSKANSTSGSVLVKSC